MGFRNGFTDNKYSSTKKYFKKQTGASVHATQPFFFFPSSYLGLFGEYETFDRHVDVFTYDMMVLSCESSKVLDLKLTSLERNRRIAERVEEQRKNQHDE